MSVSYMPQVLDTNFKELGVCDTCQSLIWTDRYFKIGEFEMTFIPTDPILEYLVDGNYLVTDESEHFMIIEQSELTTDAATGKDLMVVSGRSGESIINRRIIWGQEIFNNTELEIIKALINKQIISPTDSNRKIANFLFKNLLPESYAKRAKIEAQFTGSKLDEAISTICETASIGFKITLDDSYNFVFSPYVGEDRSYAQDTNPYVVFSPSFENLKDSKYLKSSKTLRTVALVGGEGEGNDRKYTTVNLNTTYKGLNRRELFVDARDISSTVDGGTLSDAQYMAQLTNRGNEKLADKKNKMVQEISADLISTGNYEYGRDYFMGDIVQIANQYGVEAKARVVEMIHTEDETGITNIPSFTIINK